MLGAVLRGSNLYIDLGHAEVSNVISLNKKSAISILCFYHPEDVLWNEQLLYISYRGLQNEV